MVSVMLKSMGKINFEEYFSSKFLWCSKQIATCLQVFFGLDPTPRQINVESQCYLAEFDITQNCRSLGLSTLIPRTAEEKSSPEWMQGLLLLQSNLITLRCSFQPSLQNNNVKYMTFIFTPFKFYHLKIILVIFSKIVPSFPNPVTISDTRFLLYIQCYVSHSGRIKLTYEKKHLPLGAREEKNH